MTPATAAPLYRADMPQQDVGSVDMLEVPSIQHSDEPICELFPDSEPVPAPVLEEQVPAKQAVQQAEVLNHYPSQTSCGRASTI
jgi:hypothetical protein